MQATASINSSEYRKPSVKICDTADLYTWFVFFNQIDPETYWNSSIQFLEKLVINKNACDNYLRNPKKR